ncbi:MAG: glutathione S-transferase [Pseudomonadota bacterium]
MADARSIILHQYETSPFSEKIRLALRLKNLAWCAVDAPVIMPKPDQVTLTGGYRRTPIMQIGADVYCDTAIILRELERRFPMPSLTLPGHEGLSAMVGAWSDRLWFQASVAVIFGEIGEHVPEDFKEDRTALSGRDFDTEAMKAVAPMMRDQWRSQLMWIEERLSGGKGAGAGLYLVGMKPGLVDVHAHMNMWFVKRNVPDFIETCFETAPLARAWYERLEEAEGQAPEMVSGSDAVAIAKQAAPRLVAASTSHEALNLAPGDDVAIAPDDYGKDWVTGELVHADAQRVIVQRIDETAETLHVHFPRAGYVLRRA